MNFFPMFLLFFIGVLSVCKVSAQTAPDSYQSPQALTANSYQQPSAPASNNYQPHTAPGQNSYQAPSAPAQNSYQAPSAPASNNYQAPSAPASNNYQAPSAPASNNYQAPSAPASNNYQAPTAPASNSFQSPSSPASNSYQAPTAPASDSYQPPQSPVQDSSSSYLPPGNSYGVPQYGTQTQTHVHHEVYKFNLWKVMAAFKLILLYLCWVLYKLTYLRTFPVDALPLNLQQTNRDFGDYDLPGVTKQFVKQLLEGDYDVNNLFT